MKILEAGVILIRPYRYLPIFAIQMSTTTNADDEYPQPQSYISAPVTVAVTISLLIFFFLGFFSLFFCRCFLKNLMRAWNLQQNASGNLVRAGSTEDPPDNLGLDPKIIQSFPSFPFSSVKDYRPEKHGIECAICLSEFSEEGMLRLITTCYHVFHEECIDLWFESHKTCPVCRCELDPVQASPEKSPGLVGIIPNRTASHESLHDAVTIVVEEDIPERDDHNPNNNPDQMGESHAREREAQHRRLLRSHSTGHSIVTPMNEEEEEEEEKYRLRMPEHMNVKITRGHNQTESCITFGELTKSYRAREFRWLGEASIGSSREMGKA